MMTPHANVGIHTTSTMILCVLAPRITSVIEIYYRGCDTLIHISKFTWHKTFILYSQSYATSFEARRRTHISAYYIFLTARFLCKLAKPVFLFQIRKLHLNSARDSYKGLNRMFVFFLFASPQSDIRCIYATYTRLRCSKRTLIPRSHCKKPFRSAARRALYSLNMPRAA